MAQIELSEETARLLAERLQPGVTADDVVRFALQALAIRDAERAAYIIEQERKQAAWWGAIQEGLESRQREPMVPCDEAFRRAFAILDGDALLAHHK